MKYKLIVVQLTRLEVIVSGASEQEVKDKWENGQLVKSEPVSSDVLDVQRMEE